jgi:hypothetical protein
MKNITLLSILFVVVIAFAGCKKKEEPKVYKNAEIAPSITFKSSYKVGETITFDLIVTPDTQCQLEGITVKLATYAADGNKYILKSFPTTLINPTTNQPYTHAVSMPVVNQRVGDSNIYSKGVLEYTLFYKSGCENEGGKAKDFVEFNIVP